MIIYKFYTIKLFIITVPVQLFYIITYISAVFNAINAQYFCAIIFYHGYLFITNINVKFLSGINEKQFFKKLIDFKLRKVINQFMCDHNTYCIYLTQFNRQLCKLCMAVLTLIPLNLMIMHQIFFEDMELSWQLFLTFIMIIFQLVLFGNYYVFGYLSKQIHRMAVPLSQTQWRLRRPHIRLRNKIKLMTYFERLSNTRIGITIGPTITLTLPVFAQVNKICN